MLVASADSAVDALAFRHRWLAHLAGPALYQVSVRSLAALMERRLGGDGCLSGYFVGNDKPSVYAHLRGLRSHGRSPSRSCPRLVSVSHELFIWYTDSPKKIGTKHRGLRTLASPALHKLTPMLGVHALGAAGLAFFEIRVFWRPPGYGCRYAVK